MRDVRRGEIYYANLDPAIGSEQAGERPVLIIQNDIGNRYSQTVIIAAITGSPKNMQPTHVKLKTDKLPKNSTILLEQIRTIDKQRLSRFVGILNPRKMCEVDKALNVSLFKKYMEEEVMEKEENRNTANYERVRGCEQPNDSLEKQKDELEKEIKIVGYCRVGRKEELGESALKLEIQGYINEDNEPDNEGEPKNINLSI